MSEDSPAKPFVVVDAYPRTYDLIFSPERQEWLEEHCELLVAPPHGRLPDGELDEALARAVAVVGQMAFGTDRLARAPKLKAIFNAGGNFSQNIDYETCFDRRIHVLNCGPAFAEAVAEMTLGFAIDLGRGISREDRRFRVGEEQYQLEGNVTSVSLYRSRAGIIGFGYLGKELARLLAPFRCDTCVYDPWLPDSVILRTGARPRDLESLLSESTFIFVMAGVTSENQGFLDKTLLRRIPKGAFLVLSSRAAVVDFDALLELVDAGQFTAAIDVWPQEPVPADHPSRSMEGLVLSPHRAGGISMAFYDIGGMIVDDLELILRGLAPVRMQQATWELVRRYRSQ
jgi:phosphoglycerate dehydrogenase-like enzyme